MTIIVFIELKKIHEVICKVEVLFSLIIIPHNHTLYNESIYDTGRGICLLSLVDITNINFEGRYTPTFPQSAGKYEYTLPQSAGKYDFALPHSESN